MSDDRHIVTLTVRELQEAIAMAVKLEVAEFFQNKLPEKNEEEDLTDYLIPRQDLAKMFGISTVSLDKWKRAGLLPKPVKMAGRVYYIRKEIMELIEKRKKK